MHAERAEHAEHAVHAEHAEHAEHACGVSGRVEGSGSRFQPKPQAK